MLCQRLAIRCRQSQTDRNAEPFQHNWFGGSEWFGLSINTFHFNLLSEHLTTFASISQVCCYKLQIYARLFSLRCRTSVTCVNTRDEPKPSVVLLRRKHLHAKLLYNLNNFHFSQLNNIIHYKVLKVCHHLWIPGSLARCCSNDGLKDSKAFFFSFSRMQKFSVRWCVVNFVKTKSRIYALLKKSNHIHCASTPCSTSVC